MQNFVEKDFRGEGGTKPSKYSSICEYFDKYQSKNLSKKSGLGLNALAII